MNPTKTPSQLLLIDPQNDFCSPKGSLFVEGAAMDMQRAAEFIEMVKPSEISITLDSHAYVGIERVTFWKWGNGNDVSPYTEIFYSQVLTGEIVPRDATKIEDVLYYLKRLEANGNYKLMAWPVHCVMGTWGHTIDISLMNAINAWEMTNQKVATRFFKGMDPATEQYSAVQPEVLTRDDEINEALISKTAFADRPRLIVAGEASSHCVAATVRDLWNVMSPEDMARMILLCDAMSPVVGFQAAQDAFFEEARAFGVSVLTCREAQAVLAQ